MCCSPFPDLIRANGAGGTVDGGLAARPHLAAAASHQRGMLQDSSLKPISPFSVIPAAHCEETGRLSWRHSGKAVPSLFPRTVPRFLRVA
jgi:hypothetical protein